MWNEHSDGLWIVDPIDGTNNFVNGLPHFAVSVALVKNGHAELGVIYNPVSGECFYAERGKGAFLNGTPLPLRSGNKKLNESIAGVEIKYLRSGKLASRMNTLAPFGTIRSMGSSTLDWCYLASGRYDIYIHGGQKLWDYAAGALIFEEAGGCLTTLEGDDFLERRTCIQAFRHRRIATRAVSAMGEMDSRKSVKIPFIFKKSRLSCNLLKLFHFLTAFNTKNGRNINR